MIRIVLSVAANDAISTIQYFTVISSFAAIGFIMAIMDYEVDTSENLRRIESKIWLIPTPKSKRALLFLVSMLQTSAYAAMRITAGAMLMYVHPITFGGVDVDAVFGIYVVKAFQENVHIFPASSWLFFASIQSPFIFCTLFRRMFYLRNPYYTNSGRVYTCFLFFGYVDAFGMLFAAKILSSLTPESKHRFF